MDRCLRHQGRTRAPCAPRPRRTATPIEAFKAIFQNDQLLWVALSYLLYAIANVATTGVLMYMFKFILNNSAAYSIVGVVSVIAGIIMAPLYPILNKRIPRRYLYLGGMVLMVLGYLLFIVGTDNLAVVTVGWCSSTCRRPSSR